MASALLDTTLGSAQESVVAAEAAARLSAGEALRREAAERLAAHRLKRAGQSPPRASVQQAQQAASARASQIAAAVAERYAKTQSYHAFLAAEAGRAVQEARAAAEMATLKARAMEAAQQSLLDALEQTEAALLDSAAAPHLAASEISNAEARSAEPSAPQELSFWPEADSPNHAPHAVRNSARQAPHAARKPTAPKPAPASAQRPCSPFSASSFAVRMEDEVALPPMARDALRQNRIVEHEAAELLALDDEIALLHAPAFEEFLTRSEPLPANLIEFPRQLVAPRKARPRLAEGPLREDEPTPAEGQLRIFEVEPAHISTEPAAHEPATNASEAQWTSIFLGAQQPAPAAEGALPSMPARFAGAASAGRRAAAAVINTCIVGAALAAFGVTAMWASGNLDALHTLSAAGLAAMLLGRNAEGSGLLLAAAAVAAFLCFAYQALFFTFSDATPGMRCARIGLCTFADDNPTRRAMRRRILAVLLSTVPFGLGFLWTLLDEEKLSWHDRVSGMYLREY